MTSPTTLAEQISTGRAAIDAEAERLEFEQMLPPAVYLYDGHQRLQHVLLDVVEVEVEEAENDVASITVTIDDDHPAADWLRDRDGRVARGEGEHVHVEYRHAGTRVSGRVDENGLAPSNVGHGLVTLTCLGEYQNLKIPVWSNPFLPAIFQFPRIFLLAGPAIWTLKTTLFLQLLRINSSIWQVPDDPMNPLTWLDGLDMSNWDIVVKPTTLLEDLAAGTVWTLFVSRFGLWTERAAPVLDDAELTVVTWRHREGDPEPWPGARVKPGALIVDIVDNSRHREGRANKGSIFDGMTRTVRESIGELLEDTERLLLGEPVGLGQWWNQMFTTAPGYPTVHVPADGYNDPTVKRRPPGATILTMGGASAPGFNETIGAGIQAVGDLVTSNIQIFGFGIGPQGGAINTLLEPFYTDVVAAFVSVKLPARIATVGSSREHEAFADLPGKAYTLSSLLALRTAVRASQGGVTVVAKFPSDSPYVIGQPGHGHAWIGDPVSFEIPADINGGIEVQRIRRVKTKWSASDDFREWEAELGAQPDLDPFEVIADRIRNVAEAAKEIGAWA